jgi:hypothetical protein
MLAMLLSQGDFLNAFQICIDGLHAAYCFFGWWPISISWAVGP